MTEFEVRGDFACFTRPETRRGRVSHPVPTPSALRGLMRSVFWKPAIQWRPVRVEVLSPLRWHTYGAKKLQKGATPGNPSPDRSVVTCEVLRDVAYRVIADLKLVGWGTEYHPSKYYRQFEDRVERGQFFYPPFLGMKEFAAHVHEPCTEEAPANINLRERLMIGWDYERSYAGGHETFDGKGEPKFVLARVEDGVYQIDESEYDRLLD
jgi:CRISPR-associated protein Cas5d